jgi:hypothetical protein
LNGPPARLRIKQERSSLIDFSRDWKQVNDRAAVDGRLKRTSADGGRARFTFDGTSVAWGAKRNSEMGRARYRFDGSAAVNVELQSADTLNRRLVAVVNSTPGSHTFVIRNKATPGHPKITLDFIAWLD